MWLGRLAARRRATIVEAAIVLSILIPASFLSGGHIADVLSGTAVFLTFLCTQTAFDMTEELSRRATSAKPVSSRYRYLFLCKEAVWVATFCVIGSLPLLISTGVFATYPYWRRWVRSGAVGAIMPRHSRRPLRPLRTRSYPALRSHVLRDNRGCSEVRDFRGGQARTG